MHKINGTSMNTLQTREKTVTIQKPLQTIHKAMTLIEKKMNIFEIDEYDINKQLINNYGKIDETIEKLLKP